MCTADPSPTRNMLSKIVLTPGEGIHCPAEGSECMIKVNTVSSSCDHCFSGQQTLVVTLGNYSTECQHKLHILLASMKQGEISRMSIHLPDQQQQTSHTVDTSGQQQQTSCRVDTSGQQQQTSHSSGQTSDILDIRSGQPWGYKVTVVEVSLLSFTAAVEVWRLTAEQLLAHAADMKSQGNNLYKEGKVELSFLKYSHALKCLLCAEELSDLSQKLLDDMKTLKCQCYLNLSACQLSSENNRAVIENCSQVLSVQPTSVKALYRRATAHSTLGSLDLAHQDLQLLSKLQPTDKRVHKALAQVSGSLRKQENKMAEAMKKLFR